MEMPDYDTLADSVADANREALDRARTLLTELQTIYDFESSLPEPPLVLP